MKYNLETLRAINAFFYDNNQLATDIYNLRDQIYLLSKTLSQVKVPSYFDTFQIENGLIRLDGWYTQAADHTGYEESIGKIYYVSFEDFLDEDYLNRLAAELEQLKAKNG